jgi:ubiquinone/menaquinone biosynthesis C-methylase UbiE
VDALTQQKWDRAARTFDLMNGFGPELRWAPAKRRLFSRMRGKVLFVAIGTGLDIQFFPPNQTIVAIDISEKMLDKARQKSARYEGRIELRLADIEALSDADATFDQVFSSCTFCSVPRPAAGLMEVHRVLKPGGELHMFEHTASRYFPFSVMLRAMTPLSSTVGPDLDRDTIGNVQRAGFSVTGVESVFLDVVNLIHARRPDTPAG